MKKLFVHSAPLIAFLVLGANVWATSFDALYVFGDSLSDAGNSPSAVVSLYKLLGNSCDPFHPCPPYVNGHYSNGPTAAEYLANAIVPAANFHSFAVSGATTGVGNFGDGGTALKPGTFGLPGMFQELALYISLTGGIADPNALYFVWGGANDLITLDSPVAAAQNVAGYVAELAMDGATHFLVPNLPNLGLTPFVQSLGPAGVAAAQGFSLAFNATLLAQLDSLRQQFPNRDITEFDIYSFVNDVVANPGDFGFTNAQDSCLSPLLVPCANPNQYVFWDSFHPTTQADAFIGAAFAASIVPEPGSMTLLVLGLIIILALKKQRAAQEQARASKQGRFTKTFKVAVTSAFAGVIVFFVSVLHAHADLITDQQQLAVDATAGFVIAIGGGSQQKLAQVVTTGISGFLTAVRLPVGGSGGLLVQIQGVTGNLPNGIVLTSQFFDSLPILANPEFMSLPLSNPVLFSTGNRFAIVLSSAGSFSIWPGPVGNPYLGGDGYFDARPNPAGVWVPLELRADLPFQTLVETGAIPEPSTVLMLGIGSVSLFGFLWGCRTKLLTRDTVERAGKVELIELVSVCAETNEFLRKSSMSGQ